MPIIGATDAQASFPPVGSIRKGGKKVDGRMGKDLDHYRIDPLEGYEGMAEAIHESLGTDKPRSIPVVFPFNEIERVWDAWLEGYKGGRMMAQSDGEIYHYLVDGLTGKVLVSSGVAVAPVPVYAATKKVQQTGEIAVGSIVPYVKDQPATAYKNSKGKLTGIECKPRGRLKVMIPLLERAVYFTALTNSWNDVKEISANIKAIKALNNGELRGIPCRLQRVKRSIQTPTVRRKKWLMNIEADPEWVRHVLLELKQAALPSNGLALPEQQQPAITEKITAEIVDDAPDGEIAETEPESDTFDYTAIESKNDYWQYACDRGLKKEQAAVMKIFEESETPEAAARALDKTFPE